MLWNFVLHSLRRLLPDLRAKLACSARSDNALRSGAMLAHESANASLARSWYAMQENSNASAYSVWSDRTFYCIGYSAIIINAARTLLTKACKSGFYLIVAFWLRFLFMAKLIWLQSLSFVAKPIQQEVNETTFRDFQHIRCLHLEHTRPNVANVNPTQANAC